MTRQSISQSQRTKHGAAHEYTHNAESVTWHPTTARMTQRSTLHYRNIPLRPAILNTPAHRGHYVHSMHIAVACRSPPEYLSARNRHSLIDSNLGDAGATIAGAWPAPRPFQCERSMCVYTIQYSPSPTVRPRYSAVHMNKGKNQSPKQGQESKVGGSEPKTLWLSERSELEKISRKFASGR